MKKLLILTLVLGLTSVASAAISWDLTAQDVPEGTSITITISSDNTDPYGAFVNMEDPAGAIGALQIMAEAGDQASWTDDVALGVPGYFLAQANASDPGNWTIVAGAHFTLDYTALDAVSPVTITLLDFNAAPIDAVTVQNTPEPMTLGLLGLGGLFLRRRK